MTKIFASTLRGSAFTWFKQLPQETIKSWTDVQREFLARFFEDDTKVSILSLLAVKQEEGETVKTYVERFRELSVRCPHGMTQDTLVETYRHNMLTDVLDKMGSVEPKSSKDLLKQGEQAEDIIRRLEKRQSAAGGSTNKPPFHFFRSKGKDIMAMAVKKYIEIESMANYKQHSKVTQASKAVLFKDEHTATIFNLLSKRKMLKLLESKKPEKVGKTNDPNYCLYHRIVGYPPKNCFILKEKILALIDAGSVQLKAEQKMS